MSNYERNIGRLKRLDPLTLDDVKEIVGKDYYEEFTKDYDADLREIILEAFCDNQTNREIVEMNGEWYEVLDHQTPDATECYCNLKYLDDGTIEFDTYHYNGGAHWTELVEEKLHE